MPRHRIVTRKLHELGGLLHSMVVCRRFCETASCVDHGKTFAPCNARMVDILAGDFLGTKAKTVGDPGTGLVLDLESHHFVAVDSMAENQDPASQHRRSLLIAVAVAVAVHLRSLSMIRREDFQDQDSLVVELIRDLKTLFVSRY